WIGGCGSVRRIDSAVAVAFEIECAVGREGKSIIGSTLQISCNGSRAVGKVTEAIDAAVARDEDIAAQWVLVHVQRAFRHSGDNANNGAGSAVYLKYVGTVCHAGV